MEYRILGKTGLKISRLGFGGIPIQRIDAEGTRVLMHQLKDNGINVVEVTSEQKDAFIESAASVYDLFIEKYGGTQELIDLAMKYNDDF